MAYQIFSKRLSSVEYLTGYEGNAFALTGNVENDLLSLTSVHPMREDTVMELLRKADIGWQVIEKLVKDGSLVETEYQERKFYVRKFARGKHPGINTIEV